MNKADLVVEMAKASKISHAQAAKVLDTLTDGIATAMKRGDKVTLVGFGTFSVAERKARNGRNPQTGERMRIRARKVPKFTAGKELKEAASRAKLGK